MHMDCNIISSCSKGNAVILNKHLLIDCGVTYKVLKEYAGDIKLVLLTHIHSDHFNKTTIKRLAAERPTVRFACGRWLAEAVVNCGVSKSNIDIVDFDHIYSYSFCNVIPFFLKHDVPNCGYHIHLPKGKVIYATDCSNLNGIRAPNYDLYLIEANYDDAEIRERIKAKEAFGEYSYEKRVLRTHLSKAQCNDFIYSNAGPNSRYIYMHQHEEVTLNDNNSKNIAV